MEQPNYKCIICDKDTSDNPQPYLDAYPGWHCCAEHAKYKYNLPYFMIPFAKKELGFPYENDLEQMQDGSGFFKAKLDCAVCEKLLSEEEIEKIKSTDKNFYCTEHEEIKFCWNGDYAKKWFEYKVKMNIHYDSEKLNNDSDVWNKFCAWYNYDSLP